MTRAFASLIAAVTLLAAGHAQAQSFDFMGGPDFGGGRYFGGGGSGPIPRTTVYFNSRYAPGTIVVNTAERRLYLVLPNGQALRYGIGVGRDGFRWQGLVKITQKKEWPDWTPPEEMIQRQPYLPRWMAGGPGNPLGARAMYLGNTVYRIHGTNQPQTIGTAVSSGCFRLTNPDVSDLYDRIPVGTKVIIRQRPEV